MTLALIHTRALEQHAILDSAGETLRNQAINRLGLSARAYHRLLRVARTIADAASSEQIGAAHIAEAIQFLQLTNHG